MLSWLMRSQLDLWTFADVELKFFAEKEHLRDTFLNKIEKKLWYVSVTWIMPS